MITSARITALRELNETPERVSGGSPRCAPPQIATLAAEDGPLQMSLFDTHDLAEISHPDYPGERLIACRNPALAAERARKRAELLAATEADLAAIAARVASRHPDRRRQDRRGLRQGHRQTQGGQALSPRHHRHHASPTSATRPASTPKPAWMASTCCAPRVPATELDPAGVVESYKNLAHVERDFRSIKTDDLDLRPIHHRLDERVRAHVLICLLACYLVWHLRQAWAPLTFTDEHPPQRDNPVAAAQRSPAAQAKASTQHDSDGNPLRNFRGLLDHLATLTRNRIRYHGTNIEIDTLTNPPPNNAAPSTSSAAPSPSPSPRSQNTSHQNNKTPGQPTIAYPNRRNFGLIRRSTTTASPPPTAARH